VPGRAQQIAAWANARLAQARTMSERHDALAGIQAGIRSWTISRDTISADGPEDERDLTNFLRSNPDIRDATLANLRPAGIDMEAIARRMTEIIGASINPPPDEEIRVQREAIDAGPAMPKNATRLSKAIERFQQSKRAVGDNTDRTVRDKIYLMAKLSVHLAPTLGDDPYVHQIQTHHLSAFLDEISIKTSTNAKGVVASTTNAAPATLVKKVSDLASFFAYAVGELNATQDDPTVGLQKRRRALKSALSREAHHYKAFTTPNLQTIFEPGPYLAANRAADYFWAPLLGLHLGMRLKEIVTLLLAAIKQSELSKVWTIDVLDDFSKNANSVRRLPVPQKLIDVGFLDYVEHVRSLGATQLFPHRDLTSTTLKHDPSKNCSRAFGDYLTSRGLTDPDLVFHSFRHTVITALQDGETPLADSMQLVGHQAQEHALKTGKVTQEMARSVHLSVYSHADSARLNVNDPMLRLKSHLERCIMAPLVGADRKLSH
jgi:integrase